MINSVKPLYSTKEIFILKCSFYLFKITGLAPVSLKNCVTYTDKNNYKVVKCLSTVFDLIYNIGCLTIYLILAIVLNLFVTYEPYADKSIVTESFENCLTVSQMLSMIIMYISICSKRNTIADSINKLMKEDTSIIRINSYYKIDSSLNIILVLCTNAIIGIGIFVSYIIIGSSVSLLYTVQIMAGMIVNFFIIEYAIILEILVGRIKSLNELIVKIGGRTLKDQEYYFFNTRVRFSNTNLIKITTIRRAMTTIYTISTLTVNLFSFPLLWIILYDSGAMIYSAYYMIMPILLQSSEQTLISTIYSGFCFVFILFSISIIAEKVENFKNEMKNTGDLIHKIMSRSTMNDKLQKELQQFARELLAYNVSFTSCNVFYLDGTLPFSIIGTIVTYLVILCQLD